jgi:hypothetical protein
MVRIAAMACQIGETVVRRPGRIRRGGWTRDVPCAVRPDGEVRLQLAGAPAEQRTTAGCYWIGVPDAGRPVCTGAMGAES